ncbi:TonB-dependent receptor [Sphingomonas suaedae]|uniref:TonB-dependent receptor n=1 Tax=Sphingomonas suaedae TaxID=2599297 RepID=A0A518RHH9_9SPHN|nr:TonB-dependent receptor [Sphingomonas suaedae]QDX26913.1 TonB-dependent receptor [Sphingomonas suaedae]
MRKTTRALVSVSLLPLVAGFVIAEAAAAPAQQTAAQTDASEPQPADSVEEIVITGTIRRSLEAAAEIKRESPRVVDSIVAEEIGKFPDPTTAAALQRVPGVQVTVGANNEITGVVIRGLGDILTTLDGREFFSTTDRSFSFQDLPAEALARVDVIKSQTADIIEGGIAGVTDLQLNKPFKFNDPAIVVTVRGNYATNVDKLNPQLGLLVTDRWDTGVGEIGALLNVSWSHTDYNRPYLYAPVRRSTAIAPFNLPGFASQNVAGGLNEYGWYERPQANAALQWQATPELEVYVDGLYAGYRAKQQSAFVEAQLFNAGTTISNVVANDNCFRARVNPAGFNPTPQQINPQPTETNPNPVPMFELQHLCEIDSATYGNTTSFVSTQARDQQTDNYLIGGGFIFERGPGRVKFDLAYQESTFTNNVVIVDIGKRLAQVQVQSNVDLNAQYEFVGNPLNDPTDFRLRNGLNQNFNRQEGSLFQARMDSEFDVGGFIPKLQFGLRFADRSAVSNQALVNRAAPGGDSVTLLSSLDLPADFLVEVPGIPRLNGGAPRLSPNPDYLRSAAGRDRLRAIYGVALGDPAFQPERRFDAKERTFAGYIQANYEFELGGPVVLDGTVGVRPTLTDRQIAGAGVISNVVTPVVAKTSDVDVLPNASARLQLGGGLQVRATYSKAIRRPGFGALNPGLNYIVATNPNVQNSGSAGNPDLRPQKSESFDATVEYYWRTGFVAVAGYYRDITDRVISSPTLEEIDGIGYNITRPRNVGQATLKGVEVSGQAFFDFLPGALSGFGVSGNFTYADSEVGGGDSLAGLPLQGVSKYNFNAGLIYEKFGLSGRVIYTHRSRYFDQETTGLNLVRPVSDEQLATDATPVNLNYVRPGGRLDFGLGYELNKNLRVDVGGTNILGNKYRSYFDPTGFTRDIRFDDTIYTVGIRARI